MRAAEAVRKLRFDTPFGAGWVVFTGHECVATVLPGLPEPEGEEASAAPPAIHELAAGLTGYFDGRAPCPAAPELADRAATPFLREVYRVVAAIPPGATMSYGAVAAAVGRPGAARAVGSAMARNPFAPVVPCHRVVPAGGGVGQYGGGSAMKEALLAMEARGG